MISLINWTLNQLILQCYYMHMHTYKKCVASHDLQLYTAAVVDRNCLKKGSLDAAFTLQVVKFADCASIPLLVVPPSLCWLCLHPFADCASIPLLIVPPSLCWLCLHPFADCASIPLLIVPPSLCWLCLHPFADCASIPLLIVPPFLCWLCLHPFADLIASSEDDGELEQNEVVLEDDC